jgi:calcineurin-like phosphoesterase family protein
VKWVTADQHFGHAKILEFTKRPWRTVDEHDLGLMKLWNSKVRVEDEVWCVGDFSFRGPSETKWILDNLRGKKHLVLGNHDGSALRHAGLGRWASVGKVAECDGVTLCHDAIGWTERNGWKVGWPRMFCGHVHEGWKVTWGRYVNVGVDQWRYEPVEWGEAAKLFSTTKEDTG